jgi:pimeloyl-ACP methyl ester carboxylesterase
MVILALRLAPGEGAEMFGQEQQDLTAEARRGLPGGFVELPAGVTHYELQGKADAGTVVLIHGNAAPLVTWDRTIGPLCDAGFRVLRYDLFGHGFSDRPGLRTYDRLFYNDQLADLLDALGIASPVGMVGTSQGGSIAACFAAENPGAVSRLALLAPFFDELPGTGSVTYRLMAAPIVGDLLMKLVGDGKLSDLSDAVVSPQARAVLQPQVAEQFRYRGKRRAILANLRGDALNDATDCYRRLGELGIPVLLAFGSLDQKLPRESMTRLHDLLPDIEYHQIDGAGHLAHYESADQVNPLLVRFLSD